MAGLESGDLEARRAEKIIAWGGAKRSPRYAKRRLALKARWHVFAHVSLNPLVSWIPSSAPSALTTALLNDPGPCSRGYYLGAPSALVNLGANLESGDPEARRAGEIIAWGWSEAEPQVRQAAFSAESAVACLRA